MLTHNLGYPRIGSHRELKKACEQYWSGQISYEQLLTAGRQLRRQNWLLQQQAGIDLIPSNDFSFYDQVLDMSLTVGAIPQRYHPIMRQPGSTELDLYFAMARGYQQQGLDLTALEMTKWFDTNYHYLVPEFHRDQPFGLFSSKIIEEFQEAKLAGVLTKPVLIGPVSYLLLGKEKEPGFHRIDLLSNLLPVYLDILTQLKAHKVEWVQFDEPFLALDLTEKEKEAVKYAYQEIRKHFPSLKILVATYFEGLQDNLSLAATLPICCLHIDLVRQPAQLDAVLAALPPKTSLSLGLVDGRNIWKNDLRQSLALVSRAVQVLGTDRVLLAPSCSLLHVPCDLDLETNEKTLPAGIKPWLAFAKQKLSEVALLKQLAGDKPGQAAILQLEANEKVVQSRQSSGLIHHEPVKQRVEGITEKDARRQHPFGVRQQKQAETLHLPLFPTTTIGSFPQTPEVRSWRAKWKKGELAQDEYEALLKAETAAAIRWQEEIGLDVLVHGEFERNDMVEYFGEQLAGFAFTHNGWVQSYGSRCVKPPVIYGDVYRPQAMTVAWTTYAQSLTPRFVKGMLTGPVTILQWSFVRNDQPRSLTCTQIALAIRDEVQDLEKAGIHIIQIDEPAIREGLPLRQADWAAYLQLAVKAFRLASSGVQDETQIHTHMCYAEFQDILPHIADMDADVITIECSRSQMELLDAFADFQYPNEIGPGVYDIHSPRVPAKAEMVSLLEKALAVLPARQLWINPDCGLKTRQWPETSLALTEMVAAAKTLRESVKKPVSL
jgi:5-methyltetrahydropteroyltriglutamate--homocysteine methyltransferase